MFLGETFFRLACPIPVGSQMTYGDMHREKLVTREKSSRHSYRIQ